MDEKISALTYDFNFMEIKLANTIELLKLIKRITEERN